MDDNRKKLEDAALKVCAETHLNEEGEPEAICNSSCVGCRNTVRSVLSVYCPDWEELTEFDPYANMEYVT